VTTDAIDAVCSPATETRIFDLTDAVGRRDRAAAFQRLEEVFALGEEPQRVLSALVRHIRNLEAALESGPDVSAADLAKQVGVDIRPYVESHYRIEADQAHRAIAGLSMGGLQTLNIAIPYLADYGYIGVFSSGIFGTQGGADTAWETAHQAELESAEAKQGLRLVWFSTGKDDFLVQTSRATVEMLEKHGFEVTFEESQGGHTWDNWRDYLAEFVPLLFKG